MKKKDKRKELIASLVIAGLAIVKIIQDANRKEQETIDLGYAEEVKPKQITGK